MTLANLLAIKSLTAQRALVVIALASFLFIAGDVRSDIHAAQANLTQHMTVTMDAIGRRDVNDAEMIRLLKSLLDTLQVKCAQDAKTPQQMRDCYDPPGRPR